MRFDPSAYMSLNVGFLPFLHKFATYNPKLKFQISRKLTESRQGKNSSSVMKIKELK